MTDVPALPTHYDTPESELGAALESCALAQRSDLARMIGDGPDLLALIQRLSTGDVAGLNPGQGAATVLTTNKGRIVQRLFVNHLGPHVLLVAGPDATPAVLEHLKRYTFAEKTGLADAAEQVALFTLTGPKATLALERAGLPQPEPFQSMAADLASAQVHVLGHDGLSSAGFTIVADHDRGAVWKALCAAVDQEGGRPVGSLALEAARIIRGIPAPGNELNEDHNPLEAGLWDAVSFDKGCYVGQEVVARLRTYDKVSRVIWPLRLPAGADAPETGTALYSAGREVGRISSSVTPPGWPHPIALAYVKHKNVEEGASLEVGAAGAPLVATPTTLPIQPEES